MANLKKQEKKTKSVLFKATSENTLEPNSQKEEEQLNKNNLKNKSKIINSENYEKTISELQEKLVFYIEENKSFSKLKNDISLLKEKIKQLETENLKLKNKSYNYKKLQNKDPFNPYKLIGQNEYKSWN